MQAPPPPGVSTSEAHGRSARASRSSNLDYVKRLAEALAQAGEHDEHVMEIIRLL